MIDNLYALSHVQTLEAQQLQFSFSSQSYKVCRIIFRDIQVLVFNEPLAWTLTEKFNHIYCQTHIQTLHEKFSFDF